MHDLDIEIEYKKTVGRDTRWTGLSTRILSINVLHFRLLSHLYTQISLSIFTSDFHRSSLSSEQHLAFHVQNHSRQKFAVIE